MPQTSDLFFRLLRAELTGVPAKLTSGEVDGETAAALFRLSVSQDLGYMVGAALKKADAFPAGETGERFRGEMNKAVFRCVQLQQELENAGGILEKAEISCLPLKGAVLRVLYPAPQMRTSSDVDILVRRQDFDRALALFEGLGYTVTERWLHDVSLRSPAGVSLELHFSLFEDGGKWERMTDRVWESALPAEKAPRTQYVMSHEWFTVYHTAHMAKHFVHGGCGVRPVMDLWVMARQMPCDPEALKVLLDEYGLADFYAGATRLAGVWFDGNPSDPLTDTMQSYLLSSGLYGRADNRAAISRAKAGGGIRWFAGRLFVPYGQLAKQYPGLRKHPALFPAYQVRRWFSALSGGGFRRAKTEVNAALGEKERAQSIGKMLSELRLGDSDLI